MKDQIKVAIKIAFTLKWLVEKKYEIFLKCKIWFWLNVEKL